MAACSGTPKVYKNTHTNKLVLNAAAPMPLVFYTTKFVMLQRSEGH